MEPTALLNLTAGYEDLAQIRAFVTDAVMERSTSEDVAFRAALVVDEICSNIIEHGGDGQPVSLRVTVTLFGNGVQITVRDATAAFDPASVTPPDVEAPIDARAPRGLGLHLVYELAHEVRYDRTTAGNALTIVFAPG